MTCATISAADALIEHVRKAAKYGSVWKKVSNEDNPKAESWVVDEVGTVNKVLCVLWKLAARHALAVVAWDAVDENASVDSIAIGEYKVNTAARSKREGHLKGIIDKMFDLLSLTFSERKIDIIKVFM